MKILKVGPEQYLFEVDFLPKEKICGLRMDMTADYIQYSPALMEDRLVKYALDDFIFDTVYLPLPNGLITVADNLYWIKHNENMHVACRISKKEKSVGFRVENAPEKQYVWKFTLFSGEAGEALKLANRINVNPVVIL